MSPVDLLIETGEKLHGPNWITKLADDLCVSSTTIRYWVNGKMTLKAEHPVFERMFDLVDLKILDLISLKQKFVNPGDVLTLASRKNLPPR
jgi:hypothetical protein